MTKEEIQADFDKRGLTKIAYAKLMGVTERTVYRWLSGDRSPTGAQQSLIRVGPEALEIFKKKMPVLKHTELSNVSICRFFKCDMKCDSCALMSIEHFQVWSEW